MRDFHAVVLLHRVRPERADHTAGRHVHGAHRHAGPGCGSGRLRLVQLGAAREVGRAAREVATGLIVTVRDPSCELGAPSDEAAAS